MRHDDLRKRTKQYALAIIRLYKQLPNTVEAQVIGRQMIKSGTSVGAHYREAYRSRSDAEYISKIEGALQELDETGYWLELILEAELLPNTNLDPIIDETNELTAIFVTCVKNAKDRRNR